MTQKQKPFGLQIMLRATGAKLCQPLRPMYYEEITAVLQRPSCRRE
jgi:hypothetical protein